MDVTEQLSNSAIKKSDFPNYAPWGGVFAEKLYEIVKQENVLPVLDVQVGDSCSFNCVYCDTPHTGRKTNPDLPATVERFIDESGNNIRLIKVCGLGDPLHKPKLTEENELSNFNATLEILEIAQRHDIMVSAFVNYIDPDDDEIFSYIKDGTFNLLYKCDTLDSNKAQQIYEISEEQAERQIQTLYKLTEIVKQSGKNNVALSVVPTKINQDEYFKVIDFAIENGLYPDIADLEEAGKSVGANYQRLAVDEEFMRSIKNYTKDKYNFQYNKPVCAAIVAGLHLDNDLMVSVDSTYGLSCPWFSLQDPEMKPIGSATELNYRDICGRLIEDRKKRAATIQMTLGKLSCAAAVFGGCGGNIPGVLDAYRQVYGD